MSSDSGLSLTSLRFCCSLCLEYQHNRFRRRLEQSLPLLDQSILPTTGDERIDAAMEVLQMERKRRKMVEAEESEDGDGIRTLATDQNENMADQVGKPQAPASKVDNAIKILVSNAIEEFGFAYRDVYNGVFNLPRTKCEHANVAFKYRCSRRLEERGVLETLVEMFSENYLLDDYRYPEVAVNPHQISAYGGWTIDIKSVRIKRRAVESLRLDPVGDLWKTYSLLRKLPNGSNFAGLVFEAITHRMLSGGWQGLMPHPARMASDGGDPPVFSTDPSALSSSTPDTLLSSLALLRFGTRAVTQVDFTHELSDVTLDEGKYYVSATTNNPLFDSFTIDHDLDRRTVVISVFQVTISERHEGSTEGYPIVRRIMACVRKLLNETGLNAIVKVVYFLVCPEDGTQHQWQMPMDWNKNLKTHDHRDLHS